MVLKLANDIRFSSNLSQLVYIINYSISKSIVTQVCEIGLCDVYYCA